MKPILQPGGALLVPVRVEAQDGTLGDALVLLRPGDPDYAAWLRELRDYPQLVPALSPSIMSWLPKPVPIITTYNPVFLENSGLGIVVQN